MHQPIPRIAVALLFLMSLAACGGGPPRQPLHREEEWHPPIAILQHYADKDGNLTRAELETGLRRDFDAADANHSGVLEPDEVRAVNEQRWNEDKSAISPLQDWNGDGVVDFNEFAATARALFRELDRTGRGVLTRADLHPGQAGPDQGQQDQDGRGRPRGGRDGGGPGGGPH